ncbi:MAG: hypothetical protein HAW61_00760 [Candidatus Portiera sp.]|nr:hypothetical protein [Portiera sp.]
MMKLRNLIILTLAIIYSFPSISHAITAAQAIKEIQQIDPKAAIILGSGLHKNNLKLIELNTQRSYIPASVLKIPLVLSAHNILGKDFRFTTAFYKDRKNNLIIKGRGDPFLTSEEIRQIAVNLKMLGNNKFNGLVLDDSLFKDVTLHALGKSDNPYDAKFASLLVNFNTINIQKLTNQQIVSAEKQTPTLPLMDEIGASSNIKCCNKATRINLQGNDDYRRKYVVQLFYKLLSENGISFSSPATSAGSYKLAKIAKRSKPIYTHYNSRTMAQVSEQLLLYSNNLIAMGVLLQFAPDARKPVKSSLHRWQKDLNSIEGMSSAKPMTITEPSGLDRHNQVTAENIYSILKSFADYSPLLPYDARNSAFYKTGTLTGIYNLAGYIRQGKHLRPFVILTENKSNERINILNIIKRVD